MAELPRTSYSVDEAAFLLNTSAQTIRRRLRDPEDVLAIVPGGSRPVRVSATSIQRARRTLAAELGMYLDPPTQCRCQALGEIEVENESLRRLVRALRLAQSELLRNLGDVADPVFPNNGPASGGSAEHMRVAARVALVLSDRHAATSLRERQCLRMHESCC